MTKTAFITMLLFILISSCKVTEKNITGLYTLDHFTKTTLKINSDKTFEFLKINRNPYLHPFDHPDEYYFNTKGNWQRVDKKIISLTSQSDTLIYPLVIVRSNPARDKEASNFTFFDTYGDTVKLLSVKYSDSSIVAAMHSSMNYFIEDLTQRDTFKFHFYGYRPYIFISDQKINQDYSIILKPSFHPNLFLGTEFKLKHKKLIEIKSKARFKFR